MSKNRKEYKGRSESRMEDKNSNNKKASGLFGKGKSKFRPSSGAKPKPGQAKPFYEKKRKPVFSPNKSKQTPRAPSNPDETRLNKYIANAGICSRREADELIKTGAVKLNGKIVTEMGIKVKRGDIVFVGEQKIKAERLVYVLLNKPKDHLTTSKDPGNRKTVMNLVSGACKERIYPVGRLDRNATGLMLLTNDGELTKRLTNPKKKVKKIYYVKLDKSVSAQDLKKLTSGVEVEGHKTYMEEVSYLADKPKNEIGIETHSSKSNIIKKTMKVLGYTVSRIDRVYLAGLTKKNLPRGNYKILTNKEVQFLKMELS